MFELYLITGATGNLGGEVARRLLDMGARVRALVFPGDSAEDSLPDEVEVCHGDVVDTRSMESFFEGDLKNACLIHCAGLITIATLKPKNLWRINVEGTENVLSMCADRGVGRVIYVSSVHAIPEGRRGDTVSECYDFSPKKVRGHYAKSKAAATAIALKAAESGLNLSVVHPSGILCPSDRGKGNISATVLSYCKGKLPMAVRGGYDFVDLRDVAEGVIACSERGRRGECYILSGQYATLKDILEHIRKAICGKPIVYLPLWIAKTVSPFYEWVSKMGKKTLFLTPYSAYTLGSNAKFSRAKAALELGYAPRGIASTLNDMLASMPVIKKALPKKRRARRA